MSREAVAANTDACLKALIGHQVIGVLVGQLPISRADIARKCRTFVLDDGRGFTFSSEGSFWLEPADEVYRAVQKKRAELIETSKTLEALLEMAGPTHTDLEAGRG